MTQPRIIESSLYSASLQKVDRNLAFCLEKHLLHQFFWSLTVGAVPMVMWLDHLFDGGGLAYDSVFFLPPPLPLTESRCVYVLLSLGVLGGSLSTSPG